MWLSERMEFVFANAAARELVPERWFGKHCFELLPVVDEACAFHCPKIASVTEATDVVYCEETICPQGQDCEVFGVGLIPLGTGRADRGRAVLLMRGKNVITPEPDFEAKLLRDAEAGAGSYCDPRSVMVSRQLPLRALEGDRQ